MSQFDCDLKREVDRVTRQRSCTDFNVQMLSRFHGDLTAQTGMTVPPNKSFNNVASCFPLSQPVSAGCAIDKKKSSPMSIKERLMNESGKIFKIPKREIRPSANKAKLNDWLAHNKKQPIKRKLNNDDDCETPLNSKRIKITAEYIPQVYRGRFGRKHRFHRVRYFQLFVVIRTVPTEE